MSSVKGGLVILKEMVNTLPPSEGKIAQYIIDYPQEAILLTALQLGENSKTSSAAVIRLCKSLGFNGFQELKIRVAGDLQDRYLEGYRDIHPNEDYQAIIEKMTSNTIQTLKETTDIMSGTSLEKAVDALIHAKSIVFIGYGASYIAAKDAEQKFLRISKNAQSYSDMHMAAKDAEHKFLSSSKNAQFYSDMHMAATSIANKGSDDVVVGISFSGATSEVAKLLTLAKQRNATTISITKYGNSLVSNISDIQLHTSAAKEATFRSGATSSRIAQLHLIDILFMCLASKEYEQTIKYLDETRDAVAFLKE